MSVSRRIREAEEIGFLESGDVVGEGLWFRYDCTKRRILGK